MILRAGATCLLLAICVQFATAGLRDSTDLPERRNLIVQTVGACAVNTAITEALKSSVKELRPNGEDHHSFPSRHTSWTFTATTVLSNNLYSISPWLPLGSQTIADIMALQRIGCRAHYASDVIAGATIGIFSAELSTIITRKILGGKTPFDSQVVNDFRTSLSVTSRAVYHPGHFTSGTICTGYGSGLEVRVPVSEHWGLAFSTETEASPVKMDGGYCEPLWGIYAMAGTAAHFPTAIPALAFECALQVGGVRYLGAKAWRNCDYGIAAGAQAGISWRFTNKFGARMCTDYRMTSMHGIIHAVGISISSIVYF